MNHRTKDILKNCVTALGAPMRITVNHVRAIMLDCEIDSCLRVNRQVDRANIYNRFLGLKQYHSLFPDQNGQLVYMFLCSIEMLPAEQRENLIFQATAFITGAPETAKKRIAQSIRKASEQKLTAGDSEPLLLT